MVAGGNDRDSRQPILDVVFFRTEAGNEPVREWLQGLAREDRKTVGEDIKTAQFGWPIGMPLIRKLASDLWEVAVSHQQRDFEGDVHGRRADDGSSSRLSEEVTAHAPGRPHDSEAKARPTPIGMTHEKEAHRQQAR